MTHHRILTIALAFLALVLAASPALAAKAPHRYSPKHGAKCRKTYKRVKHGKKVYCVKQEAKPKKTTTQAPGITPSPLPAVEKTKLHAHLDPTFTQNPLNPFEVTYEYSASASQQAFSGALALTDEGPAPLPSGVLSLFSDGTLECAINVGSGIEGSECPVTYKALGEHKVTTIYTSGEQSATETEVENIEPLPSSISLTATYEEETQPGYGTLKIQLSTEPLSRPAVSSVLVRLPGDAGAYWEARPSSGVDVIEVPILCEEDIAWFGRPDAQGSPSAKEPLSFFEGSVLVASFEGAGYQPSTAEAMLPTFTSCLNEG